jgi:hypothetical protein
MFFLLSYSDHIKVIVNVLRKQVFFMLLNENDILQVFLHRIVVGS